MLSLTEIVETLPIQPGDCLWIASDITKLFQTMRRAKVAFDADSFIEALQVKLGENGTLLFPTFNWDFRKGKAYDIRNSPQVTGALSKAALKRPDFVRTAHPIHSFAVWGKHQKALEALTERSSFGPKSVFAFLHEQKAKMLIIDLDYQRSYTFMHYVEENEKVWFRHHKTYRADYTDKNGVTSREAYHMFVMYPGISADVNSLGALLESKGAVTCQTLNGVSFHTVDLPLAYEIMREDIKKNGARSYLRFVNPFATQINQFKAAILKSLHWFKKQAEPTA